MKNQNKNKIGYRMLVALGMVVVVSASPVWSDGVNVNTGSANNSTIGDNNNVIDDAGIGVNGNVNDSNLNNNQNNLVGGDNTNANANYLISPSSSNGGNSALVLPRNPLPLG